MTSFTLPIEIWLGIATYLGRLEHLSLVSVCRIFHHTFTEALYSDLVIILPQMKEFPGSSGGRKVDESSKFAFAGPSASLLFERLEAQPTLRNSVRTVRIEHLTKRDLHCRRFGWQNDSCEPLYDAFVGAVINVLRGFPLVESVEFTDVEMHCKWVMHLASHLTQKLDIHLGNAVLYGTVESRESKMPENQILSTKSSVATRLTARSLSFQPDIIWSDRLFAMSQFLSSPSMRVLHIGALPPETIHQTYALLGQASFPHLESLTLSHITRRQLRIFHVFPGLLQLIFQGRARMWSVGPGDIPSGHSTPSILRRLELISVNNGLISAMTAGRSITTLITEDAMNGADVPFNRMEKNFGSDAMIRTLEWWKCTRVRELFVFLVENNPGLWHLTIDPLTESTSEEDFMWYLPKLVRLTELRTLRFKTLAHVPSKRTLAWESEQCQYLRKCGSPSLVSVSFSSLITWTRHPDDETLWRPSGLGMETLTRKIPPSLQCG